MHHELWVPVPVCLMLLFPMPLHAGSAHRTARRFLPRHLLPASDLTEFCDPIALLSKGTPAITQWISVGPLEYLAKGLLTECKDEGRTEQDR